VFLLDVLRSGTVNCIAPLRRMHAAETLGGE
jgi:hypothetical protein